MPESLEELPLFPLDTVLFPLASIRLHVFEERYRQMVRDCIEFGSGFGIVLIRNGHETDPDVEHYLIGTSVKIVSYHAYDNGDMDVQVQGESRFRIRQLDDTKPYLVGHVEPVVEEEPSSSPRSDALMMKVQEDFQILIEGLISKPGFNVEVIFPTDPTSLSFTIANLLPIENRIKQTLLESTNSLERLSKLIPLIEQQIEEMDSIRDQMQQALGYRKVTPTELSDWIHPN